LSLDIKEEYINEKIASAVRQAISKIENQDIIVFSALLSVAAGIATAQLVNDVLNSGSILNSLHSFLVIISRFFITLLATLVIGFVTVAFIYMLGRGLYSSTFTLIFDITDSAKVESWKSTLMKALINVKSDDRKNEPLKCQERSPNQNNEYDYVICKYTYKGPITLGIKFLAFKLELGPIVVILSIIANPLKVAILEFRGGSLAEVCIKLIYKLKRLNYIEENLWYRVEEHLTFYLDEVREKLEEEGIKLAQAIF